MSGPRDVEASAARAFGAIDPPQGRPVLIALSGGGDSMALAHLFRHQLQRENPGNRLVAATVDHGLRPDSAAEAATVARWCAAIDVPHHTLTWSAGAETTAIQARGRMGRYRLLAGLAERLGAAMVLTGHTADDQAETVAMRHARAARGVGLAGIDAATLYDRRVWFVRPLLGIGRADLRAWLAREGVDWLDDASNRDDRFERVRVRGRLATDPDLRAQMLDRAAAARARRRADAQDGAACLADRAVWHVVDGRIVLDPAALAGHDGRGPAAAMAAVLTQTGRLARLCDAARAAAALQFCRTGGNGQGFTIAGCRLRKTGGLVRFEADVRVAREHGAGGFDRLLSASDWPLAAAIADLAGTPGYPRPPLRGFGSHLRCADTLVAV